VTLSLFPKQGYLFRTQAGLQLASLYQAIGKDVMAEAASAIDSRGHEYDDRDTSSNQHQ
jgi:hypothetical protein